MNIINELTGNAEQDTNTLFKLDYQKLYNIYDYYLDLDTVYTNDPSSTDQLYTVYQKLTQVFNNEYFWNEKLNSIDYSYPSLDLAPKLLATVYFLTKSNKYTDAIELIKTDGNIDNEDAYVNWVNRMQNANDIKQLNGDYNHDLQILNKIQTEHELVNVCQTNKNAKRICDYDNALWNKKIQKIFPDFPNLYLDDINSGEDGGALQKVYFLLKDRKYVDARDIIEKTSYQFDTDVTNYELWLSKNTIKNTLENKKANRPLNNDMLLPTTEDCLKGYTINKSIGKGMYGEVFEACKPDCIYVIKKVKEFNSDEVVIGSFMGDENIGPKVYSYWFCENDGFWYIVYEKLVGETLNKYAGYTPGTRKLHFQRCISKTLSEIISKKIDMMHKLGVLHGDLHGDNIFITMDGEDVANDVFIIDYGKSKYIYDDDGNFLTTQAEIDKDYYVIDAVPVCQ